MTERAIYLLTIDPLHVGGGGYRIGRVDNTIVREAGSELPFYPGSSLNGVARNGAIYALPSKQQESAMAYQRDGKKGGASDPIARIFGYAEGQEGGHHRQGSVEFRDARLVAMPIATMLGPRWVTSPALIAAAGCPGEIPQPADLSKVCTSAGGQGGRINLGWMMLGVQPCANIPWPEELPGISPYEEMRRRLVVVHDDLLASVINANLEVRTSVAIDFATGAADPGKLFTCEALPRGTLLRGSVGFNIQRFPDDDLSGEGAAKLVRRGLEIACRRGLGGMTTRGFGRVQPCFPATWPEVQEGVA